MVVGGFGARGLATRIDDATPKVTLCTSCGVEFSNVIAYKSLIDEALQISEQKIDHCDFYQGQEPVSRIDNAWAWAWAWSWAWAWDLLLATAEPLGPVSRPSTHPRYILYTSGATGKPKGVVRDNGGHAVAFSERM